MPRNSDACERVCNLLLLLELLKAQQLDLRLGGRESLISLVGGRRGRRPRTAEQVFEQGLATFRGRVPTEPLDLIAAGLDQVLELGVPAVLQAPLTPDTLEGLGLLAQQGSRPPVRTVRDIRARLKQAPRPTPIAVAPIPDDRSEQRVLPERVRELVCAAGIIPLLAAATRVKHILIRTAAIAAIYGCGFELAE